MSNTRFLRPGRRRGTRVPALRSEDRDHRNGSFLAGRPGSPEALLCAPAPRRDGFSEPAVLPGESVGNAPLLTDSGMPSLSARMFALVLADDAKRSPHRNCAPDRIETSPLRAILCILNGMLAYAATSEIHSRHSLAVAVIRSTEERHIEIPPHEECEVLVGLGMRTIADGRTLLLCSPSLLRNENITVTGEAAEWVGRLRGQADTPLLLAVDGTGLISLRDETRPNAAAVLRRLRADG